MTEVAHEARVDRAYCPRCEQQVRVLRPWRGWTFALGLWMATVAGMLLLFPFMSADYCVMIPTFMIVVAAGGPLFGLVGQKVRCRRCNRDLG